MLHNNANGSGFWHAIDLQCFMFFDLKNKCGTSPHIADQRNMFLEYRMLS
jgi:hypothetical protein